MLIRLPILESIARGEVDLVFRRWKRPTVKAGGTLRTRIGVLAIGSVERVALARITAEEARRAGSSTRQELLDLLKKHGEGSCYRIEVRMHGEDPRIALRQEARLTATQLEELRERLDRYDRASRRGPWTDTTLDLIRRRPATLAAHLAEEFGQDTKWFKTNVRKLKELGLTESLGVGYRLSPRGKAFLRKRR